MDFKDIVAIIKIIVGVLLLVVTIIIGEHLLAIITALSGMYLIANALWSTNRY